MGSEFTFYDYVTSAGNQINTWLNGIPRGTRTKLNNRIRHLEATPKGMWQRPLVDTLTGDCDGLFEIRARLSHVQYRILGFHGPDVEKKQVTLLYGFIKSGDAVPKSACDEAYERRTQALADPEDRTVVHDFSEP